MKLYIIPAYEETIKNQGYGSVISEAKKRGYKIVVLNLQIKNRLIDDLVDKALKIIRKDTKSVIFGFSIGALIAYCISTKIKINKAIFCSISPVLGNDILKHLKINQKFLGKTTAEDLRRMRYEKIISKESIFICGDKEGNMLINRTKELYKKCKGKKELIVLKNNSHELNKAYISKIIEQL